MFKQITIAVLLAFGIAALYAGNPESQKNQNDTAVSTAKKCSKGCCPLSSSSPTQAEAAGAALPRSTRPADAEVYIISPKDGDVVGKQVKVVFGLKGMGVAPAGIKLPNTGHHHLLLDLDKLPDMSLPIPASKNHLHFGKGQTETILELEPGKHTLQLLLGDHLHMPHDKEVISKKITITVK